MQGKREGLAGAGTRGQAFGSYSPLATSSNIFSRAPPHHLQHDTIYLVSCILYKGAAAGLLVTGLAEGEGVALLGEVGVGVQVGKGGKW